MMLKTFPKIADWALKGQHVGITRDLMEECWPHIIEVLSDLENAFTSIDEIQRDQFLNQCLQKLKTLNKKADEVASK